MRINQIEDRNVNVNLNADELVMLGNILYEYEKQFNPNKTIYHELAAQIIIARDMCQYGHLDSFALKHIMKHMIAANPNGWLKEYAIAIKMDHDIVQNNNNEKGENNVSNKQT